MADLVWLHEEALRLTHPVLPLPALTQAVFSYGTLHALPKVMLG